MFKNFFQGDEKDEDSRGSRSRRIILLLAIIGILLILLSKMFTKDEQKTEPLSPPVADDEQESLVDIEQPESKEAMIVNEIERSYEKHLENMLNKMAGVSEAEVMVNLDSTNIHVFAKNVIQGQQTTDEMDRNGGERKVEDLTEESQIVLTRQGDQEVPLLIHTKKPAVRGVFIVAKGVDHGNVRMSVIDAVSKVLDVSTHKISVMSKN